MNREEIISYLKEFKKTNEKKYEIKKIGIFGSAARNSMNEESDIDVVIELVTPDIFNMIGIKQDIEEELSIPVDVVRYYEKMNSFLKNRIDNEAVYV